MDNYKRLVYEQPGTGKALYFDQIMLQILEEISGMWGSVDIGRVNMSGFSGGGQFVHRFFYLHPDRLKSVSIGAPGNATYLDDTRPWPLGIQDVSDRFNGAVIDKDKLRRVPCQLFVGSADTYHTVGYDGSRAQLSRYGVLEKLHNNLLDVQVPHTFEVEPGVAHRGDLLLHLIQPFISNHLRSTARSI